MERHAGLLLDVWREVGRHIEIGASLERIAPIVGRRLPLDRIVIRHVDLERGLVETLAEAQSRPGPAEASASKTSRTRPELEALLGWCAQGRVGRGRCAAFGRTIPGLLPDDVQGQALVGPLGSEQRNGGWLALTSNAPRGYTEEQEQVVTALLEPFTVAMENDRRLRELSSLREAVEADNRALLSRLDRQDISDSVVGSETGLRGVMEQIALVAPSDAPVLVLGETGSGKEVVARALHKRSRRATGPFLRINCGAIPPDLVDSELFGHERGSFTGAVAERKGWFERADGGTLFLDECGELPLAAQVRLLRILQDGMLERVGGEQSRRVDVRIVAATHRDLKTMVQDGRFREDLWYRIAVFPIYLPPLRERAGDIPALAAHFSLRAARRLGIPALVPTPEDIHLLVSYSWPGNVRELAAVIERAAILGGGAGLDLGTALGSNAPEPTRSNPIEPASSLAPATPLSSLEEANIRHMEAALARTRGKIEGPDGAAALLKINPHTLRARLRKHGVDWSRFRGTGF